MLKRHGNMGKATESDHISKSSLIIQNRAHKTYANHVLHNVEKAIRDNVTRSAFRIIVQLFNNVNPESRAAFSVAWDIRAKARL